MNEHQPRFNSTERRRTLKELQKRQEEAAAAANAHAAAVDTDFERSEALRRLLSAHRDYEEFTDPLVEERDMARGSLDLAAMALRHLVALWGGPGLIEVDDPMRTALADVVIEAMVSRFVGGHEILPSGGHVAARWRPTVLPSGGQQSCPC